MKLLCDAEDAIAEAKAELDAGRARAAHAAGVRACHALEDFKRRVRPAPRPKGSDPRQGNLPYTSNISDYVHVHGEDTASPVRGAR